MKQILLLIAFVFSASFGFAQQEMKKPNREEIKEAQVKFFNTELQLSEDEQAIFWPAYDKYREGMEGLNDRKKGQGKPRVELMSDAEAQAHIDNFFVKEEAKLSLRKTLYNSLKTKLNVRKLALLPQTEQKFKRRILQRVKQGRGQERGLRGQARQHRRK